MKFLADENFPSASANRLREAGHDVVTVAEGAPGSEDAGILAWAAREERVVLTFDRDYGDLIFRQRLPTPPGVVYLRLPFSTPEEPAERLLRLLAVSDLSVEGMFTVVERERARQRPLPASPPRRPPPRWGQRGPP